MPDLCKNARRQPPACTMEWQRSQLGQRGLDPAGGPQRGGTRQGSSQRGAWRRCAAWCRRRSAARSVRRSQRLGTRALPFGQSADPQSHSSSFCCINQAGVNTRGVCRDGVAHPCDAAHQAGCVQGWGTWICLEQPRKEVACSVITCSSGLGFR